MSANAGERTYSAEETPAKFKEYGLDGWWLEDGWIRRKYNTAGWQTTLLLVNTIGFIAEAADHHPDLTVTWAKVWVKLQTHSAGGITDKDFALARKIEDIVLWKPKPGEALRGKEDKFVMGGSSK
jgi:4a-hydroxytetrahydrobiopterin dehydratase